MFAKPQWCFKTTDAPDVNKPHGFVSHKTRGFIGRCIWYFVHHTPVHLFGGGPRWGYWVAKWSSRSCQTVVEGSWQMFYGRWTRSLEESYKQLSNLIKLYGWWMIAFNLFQILLLLKSNKYLHFFTPSSELFHIKIFTCTSSRYFRRILLYLYCIIL